MMADVMCPSVVTRAAVLAISHMPLPTDIAAAAEKHGTYGNVLLHTMLPFVVEHAAMQVASIRRDGMFSKV